MTTLNQEADFGISRRFWGWAISMIVLHVLFLGAVLFVCGKVHGARAKGGMDASEVAKARSLTDLWLSTDVFSSVAPVSVAEEPEPTSAIEVREPAKESVPFVSQQLNPLLAEPLVTEDGGAADEAGARAGAMKEWYNNLIYAAFRKHWRQPVGLDLGKQAEADLRVVITTEGEVDFYELSKSSGNTILDASVLRAASRVERLPPLPDELGSAKYEVTIRFQLR
jgi:TonB family protein